MTTCKDLRHDHPVPGSLEIRVSEINRKPVSPREVELYATDAAHNNLKIIIWKKHGISGDWHTNSKYKITGGRIKRYDDVSGPEVRIHSNDQLAIERLDTTSRFLVIGDTHVGYRHRNRSKKPTWARSVDARKGFNQALDYAQENSVDAILHAGDVFDHNATESDCLAVTEALVEPLRANIPFYYIEGNHDTNDGMKSLKQFASGAEMRLRLNTDPVSLENPTVNLYGIDHTAGNLPDTDLSSVSSMPQGWNVLVLHETPYPVVDEQGTLVYDDGTDVSEFLAAVSPTIDLVVTGHMHVGKRGRIYEHDVPVIITGPTARISKYKQDNSPSIWLVTVSESSLTIDRIPIPF